MCSKRGDAMGAIHLYDSARREAIKMGQYHYTVLLYLCSSAAVGVVKPAKTGSVSTVRELVTDKSHGTLDDFVLNSSQRSNSTFKEKNSSHFSNGFMNQNNRFVDSTTNLKKESHELLPTKISSINRDDGKILVCEDVKKYALQRGFEIYENMCLDKVPMNEAALTSMARMAMSMGDGERAFEMVKQMKPLRINPWLQYYEEPKLEALLRLSVAAGRDDKVYYLLHKLRTSVRQVSLVTADLIISWFKIKEASRVGKRKWDLTCIKGAIENNGGGWHGQGWLCKGKWKVLCTTVRADGMCNFCGMHLTTIDLDTIETEKFAESVASIALKRERKSSFQKFQKWLDY
ncbi:proteinaceous RNase P 1, chloroplastic/mitochondrial-like [Quillaja saponaria]|uniref:Proteinaceous RNase P 1, chloroplastic/mitochondrial-like n=1 Tax=Quillaja saponaria TaxID=32244 RepID=A0AAD7M443_QUISA|nr:proteinaceous RNase P 1, chloroplastic/mitochondrial-like [Quillaja saponaria]